MNKTITEHSFFKYIKCPAWIARDAEEGEAVQDTLIEKLQNEGLIRETELELLKGRRISEVDLDDIDEAAVKTLELMRDGAQTIYKGVLTFGEWVGRPDVLERVEGKSKLGEWYYVACDIKRSRHLKDEYRFQGSFYAEILAKVQGVRPIQGYVMHPDGTVESYMLEDFYTEFKLTLDSIEDILDGKREAHFLTSGCKQSPYFSECKMETRECDDLSLLNRVWRSEVGALRDAKIETVTQLADASMDDLKKVSGVSMDRLYFIQQQAISLSDNKAITLGQIDLPEEDGIALVVDIESDPLRDLDYLFGVLVVEGEDQNYHAFLAKDPSEAREAWEQFTNFLEQYEGANIYHYGWYESDVFRRLGEKFGVSDSVKRMFDEQMIDLLVRMREKVIFPTPFYSLKDIAKFLGFNWRTAEASGLDSILWYQDWLDKGDKDALQTTIDYNEDDVLATWYVRNWAMKNAV
ncbi:MAG: TM0106 family RecB-like putative nuclease [Candidatus Uhrbacteria bacterium]|nr:TM0106 family RecB-like putative nuclease [Candidatus Uhrbacteria bacterium]